MAHMMSGGIIYDSRTKSIARLVTQDDYPIVSLRYAELTSDGTLINLLATSDFHMNLAEFSPITDRHSKLSSHGHGFRISR